jgi:hypothetical protein
MDELWPDELTKTDSPVTNFFSGLLDTKKPDFDSSSDTVIWTYISKICLARLYFKLAEVYFWFISKITKYYPFSLLYPDSLYNYNNLKGANLMKKIEKIASDEKIYIRIKGITLEDYLVEFVVFFRKDVKNKKMCLNNLEIVLKKFNDNFYIRNDKISFRLLLPPEEYFKII